MVSERVTDLGWRAETAHAFADACREAYASVDWAAAEASLRVRRAAAATGFRRTFRRQRGLCEGTERRQAVDGRQRRDRVEP